MSRLPHWAGPLPGGLWPGPGAPRRPCETRGMVFQVTVTRLPTRQAGRAAASGGIMMPVGRGPGPAAAGARAAGHGHGCRSLSLTVTVLSHGPLAPCQ